MLELNFELNLKFRNFVAQFNSEQKSFEGSFRDKREDASLLYLAQLE